MSAPGGAGGILHASCVACEGPGGPCAALILGPSGSGKSALALEVISRGGRLVADDRTELAREGAGLTARASEAIAGLIEARGVGLLRLPALARAPVALAADLGEAEAERLPPPRSLELLGVSLPLLRLAGNPGAAAALVCLLRAGGRREAP
ncbi:MAG: HPr kinase/phosphorylase [Pseudomonadota bacterium]